MLKNLKGMIQIIIGITVIYWSLTAFIESWLALVVFVSGCIPIIFGICNLVDRNKDNVQV